MPLILEIVGLSLSEMGPQYLNRLCNNMVSISPINLNEEIGVTYQVLDRSVGMHFIHSSTSSAIPRIGPV